MKLQLTRDEALVLFEFLSRMEEAPGLAFGDPAEERVLWVLHGQLEKALTEPFQEDYLHLVAQARMRVRDGGDTSRDAG